MNNPFFIVVILVLFTSIVLLFLYGFCIEKEIDRLSKANSELWDKVLDLQGELKEANQNIQLVSNQRDSCERLLISFKCKKESKEWGVK